MSIADRSCNMQAPVPAGPDVEEEAACVFLLFLLGRCWIFTVLLMYSIQEASHKHTLFRCLVRVVDEESGVKCYQLFAARSMYHDLSVLNSSWMLI